MVRVMAGLSDGPDAAPTDWWLALRGLLLVVLGIARDPGADVGLELTMLALDIQRVLDDYHPLRGRSGLDRVEAGSPYERHEDGEVPFDACLVVARAASVLSDVRHRACSADW
jgi:hypothetical protein